MLKESVKSVLDQDLSDFEFLICEDASTDNSLNYLKTLKDPRIRLFANQKNKGLFFNLNLLITYSTGSVIKLWSQDDIMYPHCLTSVVKFHESHPEISFSYSDVDIIDDKGNVTVPYNGWDTTPEIISPWLHNMIAVYTGSITGNIANVAINKSALEKKGLFREDMKYSADFDMWERLTVEYPIGKIQKTLIKLRNHNGQLSRKKGFAIYQLREDKEIFKRLLDRTPEDLQEYARKSIKWRRNVYYFTVLFNYTRIGEWKYAQHYYKEISDLDNSLILFSRWVIAKVLTKIGYTIVESPVGRHI